MAGPPIPAFTSANARKIRVAVVGAGSAGSSCAYALSKLPSQYEVTIFDKELVSGGMATSVNIDASKYGAPYINDGVQGCSPQFANTIKMFELLGYKSTKVGMQISFGKGEDFWSNVFPSELTRKFEKDIAKLAGSSKPSRDLSNDFGDRMVYPLVALFFGTGNQTPYVSSAILERVFMDPSMKLFEFSRCIAPHPTINPTGGHFKLHDVYAKWKQEIAKTGNVTYKLGHEVTAVISRSKKNGVVVEYHEPSDGRDQNATKTETFDELVLACDADSALKVLGKSATWKEKQVLGSVKYLYDVTITHNDLAYMKKPYETEFSASLAAEPASTEDSDAIALAERSFRPLYYTKQYVEDKSKIEMSFDLTHYQPQFRGEKPSGPDSGKPGPSAHTITPSADEQAENVDMNPEREPPLERHVFQTIFLDRDNSSQMWTIQDIALDKRITERWWKQQSHRWQHYAKVVPWMWTINGENQTTFAGAWTLLNMHEIGIVFGFSAAYQLGAPFPFTDDDECSRLFKLYYVVAHASRVRKADRKGIFA